MPFPEVYATGDIPITHVDPAIELDDWQAEQASSEAMEAMHDALRIAWELGYRAGALYMEKLQAESETPPLPQNPWESHDQQ